jgi:hypothetical protein
MLVAPELEQLALRLLKVQTLEELFG